MSKNLTKYFSNITPERRREIASMGGKAAHAAGTAHKWNSETARAAATKAKQLKAEANNASK